MTIANVLVQDKRRNRSGLISVDGRTYPLKSANLSARAEGGIAATTFIQTYENPYTEALEVLYTLPLPADGAITGYTIRLGNRIIRGEVRKREEAREEYSKALLDGRTAALLEQERADTFSQKLGSFPPGETAIVEIEVLQPLAFLPATQSEPACWEYRFPTVAGVRYEGDEGRVPDAGTLEADRVMEGLPVRIEAKILIADGPADSLRPYSPHRQLVIHEEGDATSVQLESGMPLNRDLVIRWAAGNPQAGVRVIEGHGLHCDNGRYLLITLTPPDAVQQSIVRDLTLLIDASGSMDGEPIEQAKAIAAGMLHSLEPRDRFEIFAFSNHVRPLVPGPADASGKSIKEALDELRNLRAAGSTEMTKALIETLKPLRPDSQRQIVLLSDGYIGFEREVIGEILRRLVSGARVHVVGVGSSPNRTLTRGAARAGRGVELIIGLEEDPGKAVERILQATVHPVLTDVEMEGSCLVSCAPRKPRDVFAGQPALIFAEIKPEGGNLRISGRMAGSLRSWSHSLNIPVLQKPDRRDALRVTDIPIGALFGREAIEDVEIELAAAGDGSGNRQQIESLGLRHGISSSMTSLIAISEDVTVDPRDPRRRERLPVEVPAGLSVEGAGLLGSAVPRMFASPQPLVARSLVTESLSLGRQFTRMVSSLTWGDDSGQVPISAIEIEEARVLHFENQVLVVEFEVPAEGLLLPRRKTRVRVIYEDGRTNMAHVIKEDSSRRGPYRKGLTVRLALRITELQPSIRQSREDALFPRAVTWSLPMQLRGGKEETEVVVRIGRNTV